MTDDQVTLKALKVIASCHTEAQLLVARQFVRNGLQQRRYDLPVYTTLTAAIFKKERSV